MAGDFDIYALSIEAAGITMVASVKIVKIKVIFGPWRIAERTPDKCYVVLSVHADFLSTTTTVPIPQNASASAPMPSGASLA